MSRAAGELAAGDRFGFRLVVPEVPTRQFPGRVVKHRDDGIAAILTYGLRQAALVVAELPGAGLDEIPPGFRELDQADPAVSRVTSALYQTELEQLVRHEVRGLGADESTSAQLGVGERQALSQDLENKELGQRHSVGERQVFGEPVQSAPKTVGRVVQTVSSRFTPWVSIKLHPPRISSCL